MPFNSNKTVSRVTNWSPKHEEFCLANNIPPAAKLLWQWLTKLGEIEETEPDLADFNEWIKRHRSKGYCRPTLKNALIKLIDCGVVNLLRQYTWRIVKIITRPLDWLTPKKNLPERQQIYVLPPSNADNSETLIQKQQLSSSNHDLLTNEGFFFNKTESAVLEKPENEIKLSLAVFKLRGGFEKLKDGNPEGWLRTCLQKRYWEEPRNYQALLREYGATTTWHELFPTPESCPDFGKYSDSSSVWELLTQPFQPKRE
jgi:hypothetical protein